MAEMLWGVDKMTPGELERRQAEYKREALEMARRAGSLGINVNVTAAGRIDIESVHIEKTVSAEMINSPPLTPKALEAVEIPESPPQISTVEIREHELKKIVEEEILEKSNEEKKERFSELSNLREVIEKEIADFDEKRGEKTENLTELKTMIEKEIDILEKTDSSCDIIDTRKKYQDQLHKGIHKQGAKKETHKQPEVVHEKGSRVKYSEEKNFTRKNPPNFQSFIEGHNSNFESKPTQSRKGSKKN